MTTPVPDLAYRKHLARLLLESGRTPEDDLDLVEVGVAPPADAAAFGPPLDIPFPAGLRPVPRPITPRPDRTAALPRADVVVVTWTVAENDALADVFTPGVPRTSWYPYARRFEDHYAERIRDGAPSKGPRVRRLGSYFLSKVGGRTVLVFKSELHLNQDGIQVPPHGVPGNATLPVKDLFHQIFQETRAQHVFTVGTCGGIALEHDLGDVLVTRAARFRCQSEFKDAPYNNRTYRSDWAVPTARFAQAEELMRPFAKNLEEPVFGPPTKRHRGDPWRLDRPYRPHIVHEAGPAGDALPAFHPILSVDFFEFGTSGNATELWTQGCGLEMGDAALGLAASEAGAQAPKWAVIRNVSDPQISSDLTASPRALNMQTHWAVWYYEAFGYWTSVMSALATWAIVAEL